MPPTDSRTTLTESDMALAPAFAALRSTDPYGLRKFPTPGQYHQLVARLAARKAKHDIAPLYALAQRDWHVRGQTGCMFARLAAVQAMSLRWDYAVTDYAGGADSTELRRLAAQVDQAASDDQVEVISVLMPHVRRPSAAVAAVRDLVAHTPFWLEYDAIVEGAQRLHLRYPVTAYGVQAWVMAFGPFSFMPNTRRGPYLELAIRVKGKPDWLFHRLNQDREVAHLADVPMQMSDKHWEDRWTSTLRRTRMILDGEPDEISAAKCTLAVPINAEDTLDAS